MVFLQGMINSSVFLLRKDYSIFSVIFSVCREIYLGDPQISGRLISLTASDQDSLRTL